MSAKARVEEDRARRAKKREDQLREAGKGRFRETLSPFEKRRAAERERAKGNESFKVSPLRFVIFSRKEPQDWCYVHSCM